jgi:hypothetical protein
LTTKIDTLWMILGAALVSFTASSIGLAWISTERNSANSRGG